MLVPLRLLAPVAAAGAREGERDVSGAYQRTWDEVHLRQRGDRVTGTYVCCGGGTIEGRIIDGRVLHDRWKQPGADGAGAWTIGARSLEGTWGWGVDERDGGRWDLTREPQLAQ